MVFVYMYKNMPSLTYPEVQTGDPRLAIPVRGPWLPFVPSNVAMLRRFSLGVDTSTAVNATLVTDHLDMGLDSSPLDASSSKDSSPDELRLKVGST